VGSLFAIQYYQQKTNINLTVKKLNMKKIIACAAAIVVAALINTASAQTSTTDSVKKISIKVSNLHCNNDMPTIKKRLLNQEGIDEVTFTNIARECSMFTVAYHTSVTSQAQIEKTIESTPGCDDKSEMPYRVRKDKKSK
jgi:copper chaperone CopZ